MKSKIKRSICLIAIAAVAGTVFALAFHGYREWTFRRVREIAVVAIDRQRVRLTIPVRHVPGEDIAHADVCMLTAADDTVYWLKKDSATNRLLITVFVWEEGGFSSRRAAYEITSPEIADRLRTFFPNGPASAKRDRAPHSSRTVVVPMSHSK